MASTASDASRLPKAAALVSLLVLALAGVGLYALSFSSQKANTALDRITRLHRAQLTAVEAQVDFKTQVQEWKDTLLRGRNASDFAKYHGQFVQRSAAVESGLTSLKPQLAAVGLDPAPAARLLADHQALGVAYQQALDQFTPADSGAAFTVDARVRGIDRRLIDDMDALAATIERAASAELEQSAAEAEVRYARLRRIMIGASVITILAAFGLVVRVRRELAAGTPR